MYAGIAVGCAFFAGCLLDPCVPTVLADSPSTLVEDQLQTPQPSPQPPTSPGTTSPPKADSPPMPAKWGGTDFAFTDLQGRSHRLSELGGHVILLEFWASWCPPCRKGFPFLDQLQAKYATAGLKVVAITLETEDDAVQSFVGTFPGMGFLIGRDASSHSGELMQVETMPTVFLMGADGRALARFEGGGETMHQQIEKQVEAALRGEALAVSASSGKSAAGPKGNLKAWERGYLADPIMNLNGDVLKRSMHEHIHASKEAAAGDGGVAGGGCGCN